MPLKTIEPIDQLLAKDKGPRRLFTGWVAAACYSFLVLLGYARIILNPQFLSDDFTLLARINRGQGIWNQSGDPFYRPVVGRVLAALWHAFGDRPLLFHLANLGLLVGSALLVRAIFVAVTQELGNERLSRIGGLGAGAIFALWPTHSEPIAWISGMTDALSVFLGLLSLWLFTFYKRGRDKRLFVLSLVIFWLGLCSKESLITWPGIIVGLTSLIWPGRAGSGRWREWVFEFAMFLGVSLFYVYWRAHVLGTWVGGYGAQVHLNFNPWEMLEHFGVHTADSLIPGNKLLAIYLGSELTRKTITLAAAAILLALIRFTPRLRPITPKTILGTELLFWALVLLRVNLFTNENNLDYYATRIYAVELLGLAVYAFFRIKYPHEVSLAARQRFSVACWVGVLVALDIYRVEYLVMRDALALAALCGLTFVSRPQSTPSLQNNERVRLGKLGLGALAAFVLSSVPAMTLTISMNGESSRFAYGSSAFGCLSLVTAGILVLQHFPLRRVIGLVFLAICGTALLQNNRAWESACAISRMTTETVRSLGRTRRLYVLSAPDTVDAAYVYRDGLTHLPEVTSGDSNVQVLVGFYIKNALLGDSVRWISNGLNYYPGVVFAPVRHRLYGPKVLPSPDIEKGVEIQFDAGSVVLPDADPSRDHAIAIGTQSVQVIF